MPAQRTPGRTGLAFGLGAVVLVALLLFLDLDALVATISGASPMLVLAALAAYAAFFVLRGARWRLLLSEAAPGAGTPSLAGISAFGWLVNSYVPFRAGEAARAGLLKRTTRCSFSAALGSIVAERAFDLLGLAAFATGALLVLTATGGPHLPASASHAVLLAWVVPLLLLAALVLVARVLSPQGSDGPLRRAAAGLLSAARLLRRSPKLGVPLALLTLLLTAAQVAVIVLLVLAVAPDAPVASLLVGAPLFLLSFVLSITPGNVGTYEAAFVAVFALVGVAADGLWERALAVHVLSTALATALGLAGLLAMRLRTAHAVPARRHEEVPTK